MALQLKLENTNTINADGNRVYLKDSTGTYDAVTNPTGYGGVNPTRGTLAILVLAAAKTSKGDLLVSLEPYNKLSSDTFNVIVPYDGWYEFSILSLPIYNALLPFTDGTVVYDPLTDTVNTVKNVLALKVLTPVALKTLLNSSYVKNTTDTLFVAYNSKIKSAINGQISDLITNNVSLIDKRLIRYKGNYNAVRAVLQGAIYEFCRGNKYVAQKDIEFLNTNDYVSE